MKGYARGMTRGKRVNQGQVIGYVGTTGRSTGPHLHYEVHREGKKINPQRLKLPSGQKLKGKELERFTAARDVTNDAYAALAPATRVADTCGEAVDAATLAQATVTDAGKTC